MPCTSQKPSNWSKWVGLHEPFARVNCFGQSASDFRKSARLCPSISEKFRGFSKRNYVLANSPGPMTQARDSCTPTSVCTSFRNHESTSFQRCRREFCKHFLECFGASRSVIMVFRGAHGVSAHQFHTKWRRLIVATSVHPVGVA